MFDREATHEQHIHNKAEPQASDVQMVPMAQQAEHRARAGITGAALLDHLQLKRALSGVGPIQMQEDEEAPAPVAVEEQSMGDSARVSGYALTDPTFVAMLEKAELITEDNRTVNLRVGGVAIIDRLADTQGQEGTEWYNEFQRLLYRKFRKRIWRAIQNEAQDAVGEVLDQDPEAIMEQFQHGEAMVGRYSVLDQETGQAIGILASATVCISSSGEVSGSDGLVAPECDGERVQVMTYHSVHVRPQQWKDEEGGEIRRGRVSKESRAAAAVWQQAEGGEKRVVGEDIGDVLRGL